LAFAFATNRFVRNRDFLLRRRSTVGAWLVPRMQFSCAINVA
jgi:hypothetical protein